MGTEVLRLLEVSRSCGDQGRDNGWARGSYPDGFKGTVGFPGESEGASGQDKEGKDNRIQKPIESGQGLSGCSEVKEAQEFGQGSSETAPEKELEPVQGHGSAPEEMARRHKVDDALEVWTADGTEDAEEKREDEWARQYGFAMVSDRVGGVLSNSHDDSSS